MYSLHGKVTAVIINAGQTRAHTQTTGADVLYLS